MLVNKPALVSRLHQRNLKTAFFTLKTQQMFSVHTTGKPEKYENTTIAHCFGFVLEEISGGQIT